MPVNKKLEWLTTSSVKKNNSFSPRSPHLYTDLKLDLRQQYNVTADPNAIDRSIVGRQRDIAVIHDTACIENSLMTLFKTPKGARVLVPEYGTKLYEYIGQPASELVCMSITTTLRYDITTWEPRVKILDLTTTPEEDNNQINISIHIAIPGISSEKYLQYIFDTATGKIIQTL